MDELCRNYANALYDLLSPSDRNQAMNALGDIVRHLREEPAFFSLLCSYNLSIEEKDKVIENIYGKAYGKIPHFLPFLHIVLAHHRANKLPDILMAFRGLIHADLGIKEGMLYSADRLSEEEVARIEAALQQRLGVKVSLTCVVDSSLLGGVKVAIDGKVFDGTLSAKLADLKHKLQGGTAS